MQSANPRQVGGKTADQRRGSNAARHARTLLKPEDAQREAKIVLEIGETVTSAMTAEAAMAEQHKDEDGGESEAVENEKEAEGMADAEAVVVVDGNADKPACGSSWGAGGPDSEAGEEAAVAVAGAHAPGAIASGVCCAAPTGCGGEGQRRCCGKRAAASSNPEAPPPPPPKPFAWPPLPAGFPDAERPFPFHLTFYSIHLLLVRPPSPHHQHRPFPSLSFHASIDHDASPCPVRAYRPHLPLDSLHTCSFSLPRTYHSGPTHSIRPF